MSVYKKLIEVQTKLKAPKRTNIIVLGNIVIETVKIY